MDLCAIFEVLLIGDQNAKKPSFDNLCAKLQDAEDQLDTEGIKVKKQIRKLAAIVPPTAEAPKGPPRIPGPIARIEIPKFDGNVEHFSAFKNAFVNHVYNIDEYDKQTKMTLLTQHLIGEPKRAIACFFNDGENLKTHGKSSWNASETSNS
ncbi:hypothetical protein L596_000618 [Steinernema carpocapsae]|uniref:Uncharacterized protein n=1 Tax=Steinernema carpocapsae TaxID=34508 RepID=A0A4U8UL18_STECR|nr:hypothetical protein L596_000618 [Steinernema carpocapsae]